MDTQQVTRLFRAIDDANADAFVSFLTPDGTFKFGNAPPVQGQAAIAALVDARKLRREKSNCPIAIPSPDDRSDASCDHGRILWGYG